MRKYLIMLLLGLIGSLYAAEYPEGPYVGVKGGVSANHGKRYADFRASSDEQSYSPMFSNAQHYHNFNGMGAIFFGYTYRLENTLFSVSMEPFFEYSPTRDSRTIRTEGGWPEEEISIDEYDDICIKKTYGGGLNVRFNYLGFKEYVPYCLFGVRADRFRLNNTVTIFELTEGPAEFYDQYHSNNGRRIIPGLTLGTGIERQVGSCIVGLELTHTVYRKTSINVRNNGYNPEGSYQTTTSTFKHQSTSLMLRFTIPF